jgi:hypothetical protein
MSPAPVTAATITAAVAAATLDVHPMPMVVI